MTVELLEADPITRTASDADAAFVFREWGRRTRAHSVDALLDLRTRCGP